MTRGADHGGGAGFWRLAALLGTAAGPAIGGALTQALGWRSIFLFQAPAALAAVRAPRGGLPASCRPQPGEPAAIASRGAGEPPSRTLALALLSGAIAAALFLTVCC